MRQRSPVLRFLLHLLIAAYLLLTLEAFVYTMFRRHIGMFPWPVTRYFYALMAPYQGYKTWNYELVAEGLTTDGTWEVIDLLPYYPSYSRGQRNVRHGLISIHWQAQRRGDADLLHRSYVRIATVLRRREAERGRSYAAVRLWREDWPMSPDGYEAQRTELATLRTLLGQTP